MSADEHRDPPLVAIIDDEEDVITYFAVALEDHGYRVVSTSDPAEAMDLLEASDPSVICLDLVMPEQTGISLYSALSRHPRLRDVPVLILSGLALSEDLPRILEEAGGLPAPAGFLEKPGRIEQFLATVDELAGNPASVGSRG
jgi:CheY-like chemotaxis protein